MFIHIANVAGGTLSEQQQPYLAHPLLYDGMDFNIYQPPPSSSSSPYIIDGENATKIYPSYAVSDGEFLCGAVLIWPDVLLSTAFCEDEWNHTNALAYIGQLNRRTKNTTSQSIVRVNSTLRHPNNFIGNFLIRDSGFLLSGDIILIFLQSPATNSTVSMWNANPAVPKAQQKATVIGYGRDSPGAGSSTVQLKQARVQITSDLACSISGLGTTTNDDSFCATADTGQHCFGDSGGPLYDDNGIVIGIASTAGTLGCRGRVSMHYTRVSSYSQWILSNLCQKSRVPPGAAVCANTTSTLPKNRPCGLIPNCKKFLGLATGYQVSSTLLGGCQELCTRNPQRYLSLGWKCGGCS